MCKCTSISPSADELQVLYKECRQMTNPNHLFEVASIIDYRFAISEAKCRQGKPCDPCVYLVLGQWRMACKFVDTW